MRLKTHTMVQWLLAGCFGVLTSTMVFAFNARIEITKSNQAEYGLSFRLRIKPTNEVFLVSFVIPCKGKLKQISKVSLVAKNTPPTVGYQPQICTSSYYRIRSDSLAKDIAVSPTLSLATTKLENIVHEVVLATKSNRNTSAISGKCYLSPLDLKRSKLELYCPEEHQPGTTNVSWNAITYSIILKTYATNDTR